MTTINMEYVATHDMDRRRLIARIREDLRKQAVRLTPQTIERVLDSYDQRRTRARVQRTDALPAVRAEGSEPA